ncbi:GATA zinc finger domain-containing protein 1 [Striga asiatica]|uniref:GATA zinc finger domain-containing protein 1 n=1 Tax=Striga asiatica TaxID=4170 RepID=A0A5A7QY22_STRAF|nr:GATA zinc finger domain-containing protein 1 [Striga asiatica]
METATVGPVWARPAFKPVPFGCHVTLVEALLDGAHGDYGVAELAGDENQILIPVEGGGLVAHGPTPGPSRLEPELTLDPDFWGGQWRQVGDYVKILGFDDGEPEVPEFRRLVHLGAREDHKWLGGVGAPRLGERVVGLRADPDRQLDVAGDSAGVVAGGGGGAALEVVPLWGEGAVGRVSDWDVGQVEADAAEKFLRRAAVPDGDLEGGAGGGFLVVADGEHLVPLGVRRRVATRRGSRGLRFGEVAGGADLHVRALFRAEPTGLDDPHEEVLHRLHQIEGLDPLRRVPGQFPGDYPRRVVPVRRWPPGDPHPLPRPHRRPVQPIPHLHSPHIWRKHMRRPHVLLRLGAVLWRRRRLVSPDKRRRVLPGLHGYMGRHRHRHRWRRLLHNHQHRPLHHLLRTRRLLRLLLLRRRTRRLLLLLLLRRLLENLLIIINLQPQFAPNPAEHALLLQREIHQTLFPSPSKLRPVQLYPSQKMVLPRVSIAELLVVENLDVELLELHGVGVGDDELQGLVPYRVQVPLHGGRPPLLAVEICHHVRARAALPVLGEKVPGLDYLDY